MHACKKCGLVHDWCAGHRKGDGQPCRRRPRKGARVCHFCGGAAPQVIAAAERRVAEAEAQAEVRRILDDPSAPPVKDPIDSLARLAGRIEHALDVVGERVSELQSLGVQTMAGGEQIRAEARVWEQLLGHLRSSLDTLAKHGWMERQARLAEEQGALIAQVLVRVLDDPDFGATPGQRAAVSVVVPRHLRAVAG